MKNDYWVQWVKKAGIRAIKTVAEGAIGAIGSATMFSQIDAKMVVSTALFAGMISLLLSVAGLPELEKTKKGE